VRAVAFAPAGDRLASAGDDGSVRVWDATTGDELHRLTGHTGLVRAVAFAPAGDRLASAGDDGSVRVWDTTTGDELHRLTGHARWVSAVAFAPAGDRLASASTDGSVRVWDAATGDELLAVQLLPAGEHAVLAGGRVASCTAGAWRWLGWLARERGSHALTRLPAETYGPLPVRVPGAT
jgi:WD40 repeat protein